LHYAKHDHLKGFSLLHKPKKGLTTPILHQFIFFTCDQAFHNDTIFVCLHVKYWNQSSGTNGTNPWNCKILV